MTKITVQGQPVDYFAGDHCKMTFSAEGVAAHLQIVPKSKVKALAKAKKAGAPPSLEDELHTVGFLPVGDALRVDATRAKGVAKGVPGTQAVNITLDKPAGYYLIGVVTEGLDKRATWFLPEEDVVVANSNEASAFSRSAHIHGAKSMQKTVRVSFRIPVTPGPKPKDVLGAKGLVGRVVRFFKVKIQKAILALKTAKKLLAEKLAKYVDKKILKKPEGLKLVRPNMDLPRPTKKQLKAMEGKEVLLFVHGIFSSTAGAFDDASQDPIAKLVKEYDNRVLGFDHWTVSKSTLQNAHDLVADLPEGATLNIVCHSRGAGIVRCLLEHPALAKKMKARGLEVDTVVFVAGACLGSPLAHPESVDRLINSINRVAGLNSLPTRVVAYLFKLLLHGIQKLPGIESMNPDSQMFDDLNRAKKTLARRYVYFRANFDPRNLPVWIAEEIVIDQMVFQGKGNDVIVPFAGAGISKKYLNSGQVVKKNAKSYGSATNPEKVVWHTNFFAQLAVRRGLLDFV